MYRAYLLSSLKKNAIAKYPLLENALPLSLSDRAIANSRVDDVITAPLHVFMMLPIIISSAPGLNS